MTPSSLLPVLAIRETKMFAVLVRVAIFAIISTGAWAQSFQQFENASQFEKALASVDAIRRLKRLQCVIAISNEVLCECLSRNLPVDVTLRSYAAISNHEKEGSEYKQLTDSDKRIVDRCVSDR
jgi:hypothetical protein